MDKISENHLLHASNILADTEKGLTGGQIVKLFLAKAVKYNTNPKHLKIPFEDETGRRINKRTAFYENLCTFKPNEQYDIIIEVCSLCANEDCKELSELMSKYYFVSSEIISNQPTIENRESIVNPVITEQANTVENQLVSENSNISDEVVNNSISSIVPNIPIENARSNTQNIVNMTQNENTTPGKGNVWYRKPKYWVILLAALIGGIFTILQPIIGSIKITDSASVKSNMYEIVLIDHKTLKTPIFTETNPKLKIYHQTPPEIVQIVDGTAKFTGYEMKVPIIVEFDNVKNYEMVDSKQRLETGHQNIIHVRKK